MAAYGKHVRIRLRWSLSAQAAIHQHGVGISACSISTAELAKKRRPSEERWDHLEAPGKRQPCSGFHLTEWGFFCT